MLSDYLKLHFDAQGYLIDLDEQEKILHQLQDAKKPITDLWIFAHGWNNDEKSADTTYTQWVQLMQEQIRLGKIGDSYQPLFIGLYWPSMLDIVPVGHNPRVDEPMNMGMSFDAGEFELGYEPAPGNVDRIRPQGQQGEFEAYKPSPHSEHRDALSLADDHEQKDYFIAICCRMFDPSSRQPSTRCYDDFSALYDIMATPFPSDRQLETFVQLCTSYAIDDPHDGPFEERNILKAPEDVMNNLAHEICAATSHMQESFNPFSHGNPLFRAFHTFTFWSMKARAAIVGQQGVADFLYALKDIQQHEAARLHIHLLGHSFGAKLLTASVSALADMPGLPSPLIDDLILLLGAFSQFAFSRHIPGSPERHGRYVALLERHQLMHPIVAIYSPHDLANKHTYPWGMRLARRAFTYELGGITDRFGSIGANGIQGLDAATCHTLELQTSFSPVAGQHFSRFSSLNVDGQHVINQYHDRVFIGAHRDMYRPEIFHMALAVSLSQ